MNKPRLLDLFCGAGGATAGYQRAGFHVVGVDHKPQPNYCGDAFRQGDAITALERALWYRGEGRRAMDFDLEDFDAIHASPPCQHYANVTAWRGRKYDHPDLVDLTRELLDRTGLPWVIENVREAPLTGHVMLCGSMFDLRFRRHRLFENSWNGWMMTPPCVHRATDFSFDHGGKQPESVYRDAMGCEWMTVAESREAIPPAYTELIGSQLLAHVAQRAA